MFLCVLTLNLKCIGFRVVPVHGTNLEHLTWTLSHCKSVGISMA